MLLPQRLHKMPSLYFTDWNKCDQTKCNNILKTFKVFLTISFASYASFLRYRLAMKLLNESFAGCERRELRNGIIWTALHKGAFTFLILRSMLLLWTYDISHKCDMNNGTYLKCCQHLIRIVSPQPTQLQAMATSLERQVYV